MSTTSMEAPIFPPGRYGRRRSGRRHSRLVVVLAAAVMILATSFIGIRLYRAYGEGDYAATVTAFITGERDVTVTFIVRVPPGGAASCVVRARNDAGAEIGRETITITAGSDPSRTVATHRLVTSDRPVTGEVKGCVPAPPPATLR